MKAALYNLVKYWMLKLLAKHLICIQLDYVLWLASKALRQDLKRFYRCVRSQLKQMGPQEGRWHVLNGR